MICSKCKELSTGQQLCKNCRVSSTKSKCNICRSEFTTSSTISTPGACKKCDFKLTKYGKPKACACCKIVAAFGKSKCQRCASYELKYGPPVQCDECKQRSAFDKRDENKKFNGKLLCWLCSCALKRAVPKANNELRHSKGKRPHEPSSSAHTSTGISDLHATDGTTMPPKKKSKVSVSEVLSRYRGAPNDNGASHSTTSSAVASDAQEQTAKAQRKKGLKKAVAYDPQLSDHVVTMNNMREKIAMLEKRLMQKDKELLEKDKLLTELKSQNFEKETDMHNKMKEVDRLHKMEVENLTSTGISDLHATDGATMPPKKKSVLSVSEVLSRYRGAPNGNGASHSTTSSAVASDAQEQTAKAPRTKGLKKVHFKAVAYDPHLSDHILTMNNMREKNAMLEKRLMQKDKLLTELKSQNFEKETDMRNKMKEVDRLHKMTVENLNRKLFSMVKEIAQLKKSNKKPVRDNFKRSSRSYTPFNN